MADQDEGGIVAISAGGLSVGVNPLGAELHYLRDDAGRDLLWDGDPAVWTGRAPILFPVIGALAGGRYTLGDPATSYAMPRHGFARRMSFALVEHAADAATFRLEPTVETRAVYPFEFRLDIRFSISAEGLAIAAAVHNHGDTPMPASFGFHPAFCWPLPYGAPRADHRILFDADETDTIHRLNEEGLVKAIPLPSPIAGDTLMLDDALFVDDAIILDPAISRSVRYGAPAGPQLRVDFPAMPQLGIWTKAGAAYICIEPWHGTADPEGSGGDIFAKPGIVTIAPGAAEHFAIRIAVEA